MVSTESPLPLMGAPFGDDKGGGLGPKYETELSWIRQIRQELEQMEAARQ